MLDLTGKMLVSNTVGEVAILNEATNYHQLPGEWFYVVGGGHVRYDELESRITRARGRYLAYEDDF